MRLLTRLFAPKSVAHAHCDLPCGVYDPAQARIEAQSVKACMEKYLASDDADFKVRATAIKEQRADLVKEHLWVLWTDYFKPEHVEKYPDLHTTVWNVMKLAGKNRQEVNAAAADQLLAATHRFAEIFWDTKGVKSSKQPSRQAVGGEIVLPS